MLQQYRQGDVFLIPTDRRPNNRAAEPILARGEATGHVHEIVGGEVYVDDDGTLVVRASEATELRHTVAGRTADHEPITLDPAWYEVVIQREYEPKGARRVTD